MSIEENKLLIRGFYTEVIGGGDYSNLHSFVAADYVDRNAAEGGRGPEVVRASRSHKNDVARLSGSDRG